jgi:hypothetical protein
MGSKSTGSSSIIAGFVFLIFLTLKLAGIGEVATWSWWWVTSPLWIPITFVLGILLSILVISLVFVLVITGITFGIAMLLGTTVTDPDWLVSLKSKIGKK